MEGLKSLNRSSDAILSYSEETGTPIFTIDTSLMLSNLTFKSGAKGQVCVVPYSLYLRTFASCNECCYCKHQVSGLGFELTMPDIILDVLVAAVDIATIIEVDIGDFTDIKPDVKDVRFRDVGHIDVSID